MSHPSEPEGEEDQSFDSDEGGDGQIESDEEDSGESDQANENVSGDEEDRPRGKVSAGSKEVDDEDGYHQSQNESEEEDELPSSQRQSSPRRVRRSRRHQRQSSSSSESDGSDHSDHNSSAEPTNEPRQSSAVSQDLPPARAADSEGTSTDVTPLSSPDRSRLQSLDLNDRDDEDGSADERRQESALSSGRNQTPRDSYGDDKEFSVSSDQFGGVPYYPGGRSVRNYSFNNARVWCIDRENQRLLRAMAQQSSRSRGGYAKSLAANKKGHVAHSAINRQQDQQRIVRENLASLKRLVSAKPSRGMKRTDLLADYYQQRYRGILTHPIVRPISMRERTPTDRDSRLLTPSRRSATSACTSEATSLRGPGARPKEPGAPQTGWN
ncbi:uncharacterized protein LOC142996940 [Genypterus blacodes]|uniref:uncharacterized protein LOC142996940 n=1 Tax=Genypterus blacodes TaxID=154954 RepID=UPI003F759A33